VTASDDSSLDLPPAPVGHVRLFHGTTLEAAQTIAQRGLGSMSVDLSVQQVAHEFSVDADQLAATATELHALTVTQEGRADWACFATTERAAWRWASRAPETRWELLRAVWALRGRDPSSREFDGWRRLQYRTNHPAVIVFDIPIENVRSQGGHSPNGLPDEFSTLFLSCGWRIRCPVIPS
jgi:hypothetical protein